MKKGDVFFIPAGQIHAIGKGITVAEVQQSSDITYRIYDYNSSVYTSLKSICSLPVTRKAPASFGRNMLSPFESSMLP